mgnify:CR=1 FL=1|jgi:type III secretory pathway component EscV
MTTQFTTITDVTDELARLDPAITDELTEDQVREIVRRYADGGYEAITQASVEQMLIDLYMATGADEATARRMLQN